jgi:hypothetical protein
MPTRTRQPNLPTALLLLGCVGLFASGVGALPGVPGWAWLVVLALGALLPLAGRRVAVRRFDRAELRRNARARRNLRIARRAMVKREGEFLRRVLALEEHAAKGLTPAEVAELRTTVVNFAHDLQLTKSEVVLLKQDRNARRFGTVLGGQEDNG